MKIKFLIFSVLFFWSTVSTCYSKENCPRTKSTPCEDSCNGDYGYICKWGYNCNGATHRCERNERKTGGGQEKEISNDVKQSKSR